MVNLTPTWTQIANVAIQRLEGNDREEVKLAKELLRNMGSSLDSAIQFLKDQGFDPKNLPDPKAD